MIRKVLSIALSLFLMLSTVTVALAIGTPTIAISSKAAKPGDSVELSVSVSNNPGINAFSLGFEYDTSRLNLMDVVLADGVEGQFHFVKKAVWLNGSDITFNGDILTLTFKVLQGAAEGDADVVISDYDITNYNEDDVEFDIMSGKITVLPDDSEIGELTVGTSSAYPGDIVEIPVSFSENPGINAFSLGFEYDTSRLSLLNVALAEGIEGNFVYAQKAVWLNGNDLSFNGDFLTLRFQVLEDAAEGDAAIVVSDYDITNYSEDEVAFNITSGKITVLPNDSEQGELVIGAASAKAGETVIVPVSVSDNPGFSTFSLGFDYDSSKLTLNNVTLVEGIPGELVFSKKAVWFNSSNITDNGEILLLEFVVSNDSEAGDVTISISEADISDENENDVSLELVAGKVTIEECLHTNAYDVPGKAATCKETGLTDGRYCPDCETWLIEQETIDVDLTNHVGYGTETRGYVAATCTKKGYTGDTYCLGCKNKIGNGTEIDFSPHDFSVLQSDATDHWYKCANCVATTDKEAHRGGTATCTEKAQCEVCGAKYGTGPMHDYSVLQSDETDHWYKCANCDATTEKEAHSGGTATCTTLAQCEVCEAEYGELADHDYSVLQSDATDHWYKCANCDATTDKEAHSGGTATCTAKAECETCGQEYGELADHDYSVLQSDDEGHWYKCANCDATTEKEAHSGGTATCTEKAQCEVCEAEYGQLADHDYSVLQSDATDHWYKCANCDATTAKEAHSGGTATCTMKAKCEVCKVEYGGYADHDYSVLQSDETDHWYKCANCDATTEKEAHSGGTATCTTLAQCEVCEAEYGGYADHDYSILQSDETDHWYKCANCDATTEKEAHSGGTATCTAKAECETCDQEYGGYADHDYSVLQSDATDHWYKCANCDATTDKEAHSGGTATCTTLAQCEVCEAEYGELAPHDYSVLQSDATDHWYKCANCDATTEKEAHSGGTATCTEKAECETCGQEYGEYADHDYSVLQSDATDHWYKCANCTETTEKEAHSGGTATCTTLAQCEVCEAEYGEYADHDYSVLQSDATDHWYKCANCDATTEKVAHSGGTATCTAKAKCEVCDAEYGDLADHDYSVLQSDATDHWYKCANCDATTEKVAHSGGTATCTAKAKCEVCEAEYGELADHDYSVLQSDATDHWYKCTGCDLTTEKVAHSGGTATCTEKAKCDVCDAEYGELADHDYSVLQSDATDHWYKCAYCDATTEKEAHSGGTATCTEKAKCDVCDAEYGELADHDYSVLQSDATDHWYKCTGCDLTTEKVAHSGGTATCTAKAKCEVCDAEYGDLADHDYSVLQSDATDHWYKCANCDATTEKAAHSGGTATCTAKAQCEVCEAEYGELADHSYTVLQSDATDHWYKCANCDATTEKTAHSGGTATCTEKAKCDVCDAEYGELADHDYSVLQSDATDHWYKCANCTATTEKTAHSGGTATCNAKAQCEVCEAEYGELAAHSYTVLQSDATDHWYKCANCDATTEKTAHSGGTATCTAKAQCEVCEAEYGELADHDYSVLQSDATDHWYKCANCDATTEKTAHSGGTATCTAKAQCEVCEAEYGELAAHSYTVLQSDATDHWYKCANCDATTEKTAHSGGTATCTAKAKCEVCDAEYGELADHDYSVLQSDATDHWYKCANCDATTEKEAHSGGTASCTEKAKCEVCEAEYGELAGHDYSILQSDETDHWYKCANCDATTEKEAHSGGTATCTEKAKCEVCEAEYGQLADHDYSVLQSDETDHWYKCANCDATTDKEAHSGGTATCTEKAKCEVCEAEYGELADHDYSILQSDAIDHWYKCANCDATTEKEAHYGGTATCTAKAKCEVCEAEYGNYAAHTFSILKSDDEGHWYKCSNCDALTEKANHTWNDGEPTKAATCKEQGEAIFTCTVCRKTKTGAVAIDPTNHADYGTTLTGKKDATCTAKGYTGDKVCNGCGAVVEKGYEIGMIPHDYVDSGIKQDKDGTAYRSYICSICGAEKKEAYSDKLDDAVTALKEAKKLLEDEELDESEKAELQEKIDALEEFLSDYVTFDENGDVVSGDLPYDNEEAMGTYRTLLEDLSKTASKYAKAGSFFEALINFVGQAKDRDSDESFYAALIELIKWAVILIIKLIHYVRGL